MIFSPHGEASQFSRACCAALLSISTASMAKSSRPASLSRWASFEKACAVSGYLLGVNPFNQPGVESYKANMFALLGKPGYEGAKAALEAKLNG